MKIKSFLLLVMLLSSFLGAAQNAPVSSFQVKGIVLDSLTKEGEPYATIKVVRKSKPDQALKMFVTNLQGKFSEKIAGTGEFIITITSVGRKSIIKPFTVNSGDKSVDLGTLYIADAAHARPLLGSAPFQK